MYVEVVIGWNILFDTWFCVISWQSNHNLDTVMVVAQIMNGKLNDKFGRIDRFFQIYSVDNIINNAFAIKYYVLHLKFLCNCMLRTFMFFHMGTLMIKTCI